MFDGLHTNFYDVTMYICASEIQSGQNLLAKLGTLDN